jgi:hypothetical protein
MGVLLIRELNVDGCGDFADVLVQTDQPVTPEQMKELHHELTRLNNEQECPDTDDVVEEAVKNTLGETARCIDYALLEYGGAVTAMKIFIDYLRRVIDKHLHQIKKENHHEYIT